MCNLVYCPAALRQRAAAFLQDFYPLPDPVQHPSTQPQNPAVKVGFQRQRESIYTGQKKDPFQGGLGPPSSSSSSSSPSSFPHQAPWLYCPSSSSRDVKLTTPRPLPPAGRSGQPIVLEEQSDRGRSWMFPPASLSDTLPVSPALGSPPSAPEGRSVSELSLATVAPPAPARPGGACLFCRVGPGRGVYGKELAESARHLLSLLSYHWPGIAPLASSLHQPTAHLDDGRGPACRLSLSVGPLLSSRRLCSALRFRFATRRVDGLVYGKDLCVEDLFGGTAFRPTWLALGPGGERRSSVGAPPWARTCLGLRGLCLLPQRHRCTTILRDCETARLRESGTARLRESGTARERDCETARERDCETAREQDCETARLRDCETAREQDCETERLRESRTARLRNCETVRLRESRTARLRDCERAGLRDCETARLRDCERAGPRDCGTTRERDRETAGLRESGTARLRDYERASLRDCKRESLRDCERASLRDCGATRERAYGTARERNCERASLRDCGTTRERAYGTARERVCETARGKDSKTAMGRATKDQDYEEACRQESRTADSNALRDSSSI